ncbi:ABC transporter permease [Tropicimonas sediminicola]|uniref:Osmoprotectant transport system permease protein n=1 Tax=Tropicimonas sediminicola TaxID=1031541 RepID=A0A239LEZ1_9RHOB|nr:ABC transporter permease [Tropicimonas sediminicola]SNT28502.1 osmoprotectant transport system permease protein [Tropicimonas sediminicola]
MSTRNAPAVSAPGLLFAVLGLAALLAPFMTLAANRIVAGEGVRAWSMAGPEATLPGLAAIAAGLVLGLPAAWPRLRLAGAALGLAGAVWLLVQGSAALLDGAGDYARVSPGAGFWCLLVILALLMADALSNLAPGPLARAGLLAAALLGLATVLGSGALADLSIFQEYASRKDAFRDAAWRHLWLAFGSLAVAAAVGFPLGILCHRRPALREALLPVLSFLQTIPSLAMFGIMIPLLGWVSDTVPGAQAIGIAGIGFAPAFLALVLYSLLPVGANTVAGLETAPPAALEAARGMGMTPRQRLFQVELPLGLPVILAGLRIVLVQNIGLAVIAALIGGGGFGTFVFQGLNQTATDLILLGALPTVALALVSAIAMDILVDLASPTPERHR